MTYNINDIVVVKNSGESKVVSDFEIIDGHEIYYMTDKTSFHCLQLCKDFHEFYPNLVRKVCENNTLIDKISENYSKEMADKTLKYFIKYKY